MTNKPFNQMEFNRDVVKDLRANRDMIIKNQNAVIFLFVLLQISFLFLLVAK